jgi:hypothetical protein
MIFEHWWNGSDRGKLEYSEPENHVNNISETKSYRAVNTLNLHYEGPPVNAV